MLLLGACTIGLLCGHVSWQYGPLIGHAYLIGLFTGGAWCVFCKWWYKNEYKETND